jgi:hypothetical protein
LCVPGDETWRSAFCTAVLLANPVSAVAQKEFKPMDQFVVKVIPSVPGARWTGQGGKAGYAYHPWRVSAERLADAAKKFCAQQGVASQQSRSQPGMKGALGFSVFEFKCKPFN